jgi:hypothetical protein
LPNCQRNNYVFGAQIKHRKYKYSTIGLSYKYDVRSRVLEKLSNEEKKISYEKPKLFKESREIGESEILVIIEHW